MPVIYNNSSTSVVEKTTRLNQHIKAHNLFLATTNHRRSVFGCADVAKAFVDK